MRYVRRATGIEWIELPIWTVLFLHSTVLRITDPHRCLPNTISSKPVSSDASTCVNGCRGGVFRCLLESVTASRLVLPVLSCSIPKNRSWFEKHFRPKSSFIKFVLRLLEVFEYFKHRLHHRSIKIWLWWVTFYSRHFFHLSSFAALFKEWRGTHCVGPCAYPRTRGPDQRRVWQIWTI